MINRSILLTSIVLILAAAAPGTRLIGGVDLRAQQRAEPSRDPQQPNMQEMMKMHEQMMADMKAANAKLDQLTQKMDSATGPAKVDATAAVVKELVSQHRAMCDRMGDMHQQMMSGRGMMMKK